MDEFEIVCTHCIFVRCALMRFELCENLYCVSASAVEITVSFTESIPMDLCYIETR